MNVHSLAAVTTHHEIGFTWQGPGGSRAIIDHILVPAGFLRMVQSCSTLHRLARRVRPVIHGKFLDHIPVQVSFSYGLDVIKGGVQRRWCRERLMRGLRGGWMREELVQSLEAELER
eukprot:5203494-Alexandrium_andersonii.AAC.1